MRLLMKGVFGWLAVLVCADRWVIWVTKAISAFKPGRSQAEIFWPANESTAGTQ